MRSFWDETRGDDAMSLTDRVRFLEAQNSKLRVEVGVLGDLLGNCEEKIKRYERQLFKVDV
jgi:hypothetical protein